MIAASQCMHVPLLALMDKAYARGDCCEAMCVYACVCVVLMNKADAHCDSCEAMHVCACFAYASEQGIWSL